MARAAHMLAVLLAVMLASGWSEGSVLSKCQLKSELEKVIEDAENFIAKLVCTVEYISLFNTSLVNVFNSSIHRPLFIFPQAVMPTGEVIGDDFPDLFPNEGVITQSLSEIVTENDYIVSTTETMIPAEASGNPSFVVDPTGTSITETPFPDVDGSGELESGDGSEEGSGGNPEEQPKRKRKRESGEDSSEESDESQENSSGDGSEEGSGGNPEEQPNRKRKRESGEDSSEASDKSQENLSGDGSADGSGDQGKTEFSGDGYEQGSTEDGDGFGEGSGNQLDINTATPTFETPINAQDNSGNNPDNQLRTTSEPDTTPTIIGDYFDYGGTDEGSGSPPASNEGWNWKMVFKRKRSASLQIAENPLDSTDDQDVIPRILYGIFQLSNEVACQSESKTSANVCNLDCEALTDDDISDDLYCLQTLHGKTNEMMFADECLSVMPSTYFAECD